MFSFLSNFPVLFLFCSLVGNCFAQDACGPLPGDINFGSSGLCYDSATAALSCVSPWVAIQGTCTGGTVCCFYPFSSLPTSNPYTDASYTTPWIQPTLPWGVSTTVPPWFTLPTLPWQTTTQGSVGPRLCGRLRSGDVSYVVSVEGTASSSGSSGSSSSSSSNSILGIRNLKNSSELTDKAAVNKSESHRVKRIVGGEIEVDNRLCYQAAVMLGNNVVATGALISQDYVITSFNAINRADPTGQSLRLFLGGYANINGYSQVGLPGYRVLRVISAPGYNARWGPGFPINDAALLLFDRAAQPLDWSRICTICLPLGPPISYPIVSPGPTVCMRYLVSGYGSTSEASAVSDGILRRVHVPLIPQPVCENVYKNLFGRQFVFDLNSMCAGGEPGRDSCNKDGGAPLVCESYNGDRYLVGISSWGYGCGRPGYPGVYTNVLSLLPWIRQSVPN